MKSVIVIIIALFCCVSVFGQTIQESSCIENIKKSSRSIIFPQFKGDIIIKVDTIDFDLGRILLSSPNSEALTIFKQGLIFPDLILGSATDGSGNFKINTVPFLGTLTISSFNKLKVAGNPATIKTFSFLIWRETMANPFLYILQLTNSNANPNTDDQTFIKGSRLTSFGFCSILI